MNEYIEAVVPKDLISPLESSRGVGSKAFREEKDRWTKYCLAVQDYYKCSFFEARAKVIESRDQEKTIRMRCEP